MTMEAEKEYTLAEKEAIIAEKVQELSKTWGKNGRVSFYITGDSYMNLLHDFWASGLIKKAIVDCCIEGLGTDMDQALKLCTGSHMLIGDSRIDSYPGGIEMVEHDGRHNETITSLDTIVKMLEADYCAQMSRKSVLKRDLAVRTGYLNFKETEDENLILKINKVDQIIKDLLTNIEVAYKLANKSIIDLPTDFEEVFSKAEALYVAEHQDSQLKSKIYNYKKLFVEEPKENEPYKPIYFPVPDSELNEVNSCWIDPLGNVYGKEGIAWIHRHIVEDLYMQKILKEDTVDYVESLGWVKKSAGNGFLFYPAKHDYQITMTDAQKAKIVDICIAQNESRVELNMRKIPLNEFLNSKDEEDLL